jgi:hypothetical protein
MIRLYQGSGSGEIQLLDKPFSDSDWVQLRRNAVRILRGRNWSQAADLLESMPFDLYNGTNGFGDKFCVLFLRAPVDLYMQLTDQYEDPRAKFSYYQIAKAVSDIIPTFIRFIAVELESKSIGEPVALPALQTSSDAVERALADCEQLIRTRGASSGLDRVHTAFHGYLRAVAAKLDLSVRPDASITQLFKAIRKSHPELARTGPMADEVNRITQAMATIVDSLNPVRNQASIAHPNNELLDEPEAMMVINAVRTLLYYLNAKIG